MTIQQHASFDSSAAELNATSKLVKAWESKNAKNAAKAAGVSLMALSLAACGGSSSTTTTTPAVDTPADDTPATPAGQSFTFTTDRDIFVGTEGSDTLTAAAGTVAVGDAVVDETAGDGDVINMTLTAANGAASISGVETINVTWDAFTAATVDATNISGATLNIATSKAIFTTGTTVTAVGDNDVALDDIMTGTLTANGVGTSTIDAGAHTVATITAVADEAIAATVTAASATTVNVNGNTAVAATVAANTADVTIGGDVTLNSDDIATVSVTMTEAGTLNLVGSTDIETLTINGSVAVTLDTAELLDGADLVNAGSGAISAKVSTDAVDASGWATSTSIELDNANVDAITVASGASLDMGTDLTDATTISGAAASATTNTVSITADAGQTGGITLANMATATLTVDNSAATAALDLNAIDSAGADLTITLSTDVSEDSDDDLLFSTLDVDTGSAVISGTGDVDVETSFTGVSLDASGLTGLIDVADVLDNDAATVMGGSGDNTVTFSTVDGAATYVGQDGIDTVTIDDLAGAAADEGVVNVTTAGGADDINLDVTATKFADITVDSGAGNDAIDLTTATTNVTMDVTAGTGNDTVNANSITTSSVEADLGAGDDTISATAVTTGSLVVEGGDGDDTVTFGGAATLAAGASLVAVLGAGDDTVNVGEATAGLDANVNIVVTGGEGTDTVSFAATTVVDANLVFNGVEVIELVDDGDDTVDFSVAQMSGMTYTIASSAGAAGILNVVDATGDDLTVDLSGLQMTDSATTGVNSVTINMGGGDDTITGTNVSTAADTIVAGGGDDTIVSGAGAATITGGAGDDTIDLTEATATADHLIFIDETEGTDVVTGFGTADQFLFTSDQDTGTTTDSDVFDDGNVILAATDPTAVTGAQVDLHADDYNEAALAVLDNHVNVVTAEAGFTSVADLLDEQTTAPADHSSMFVVFYNSTDEEVQMHYISDSGDAAENHDDEVSTHLVSFADIAADEIAAAFSDGNFGVLAL